MTDERVHGRRKEYCIDKLRPRDIVRLECGLKQDELIGTGGKLPPRFVLRTVSLLCRSVKKA